MHIKTAENNWIIRLQPHISLKTPWLIYLSTLSYGNKRTALLYITVPVRGSDERVVLAFSQCVCSEAKYFLDKSS